VHKSLTECVSLHSVPRSDIVRAISEPYSAEYERLAEELLPVTPESSIWRYAENRSPNDVTQGYKLHVGATVLSANTILRIVAEAIRPLGVGFKAARSLDELARLNTG